MAFFLDCSSILALLRLFFLSTLLFLPSLAYLASAFEPLLLSSSDLAL